MTATNYDKIIIEELTLSMSIGIYEAEKINTQNVCINLTLDLTSSPVEGKKAINDVLCYKELTDSIRKLAKSRHFDLVEELAEEICSLCLRDSRVVATTVRVFKTEIMKDIKNIGVEIYRTQLQKRIIPRV
ncbi:MAG: dihydroneopterin aldolase [Alphaproteobacteria bacterium]|nr:dihydroneopterin aldolase [Alphaproteobacteria bacterium]QQS56409.1 MAG: dihydroneopterin aldolase [Alphaproteobacteria bacterium]